MTSKKKFRENGMTTIVFRQIIHVDLSEFDEKTANDMVDTLAYKVKKSLDDNITASNWVVVPPELFN